MFRDCVWRTDASAAGLAEDEVVIDHDLLRQVVTWAINVGETTGMPKKREDFESMLMVSYAHAHRLQFSEC